MVCRRYLILVLLFILGWACTPILPNQFDNADSGSVQTPDVYFWFNAGIGIGTEIDDGDEGVLHLNSGFTVQYKRFNFSLRQQLFREIMDDYSAKEIALLLGVNIRGRRSIAVFGLGPGKVFPDKRGLSPVIGIAFEGQFIWSFSEIFGIGVYIFGNVNNYSIAKGMCISLQIGRLR